MSSTERIPYQVQLDKILEVLAKQIYQSPITLLRENCQNAYDAVLMRLATGQQFEPTIKVSVVPTEIRITDNGIGMTKNDLIEHFWRAGASGKNNPKARAAGVVGTFGIGAMANFGIASVLTVITESAITGERIRCVANKATLSTTSDCIELNKEKSTGEVGTTIIAEIPTALKVNVDLAINYISESVRFLEIPVLANDKLISQVNFDNSIPRPSAGWSDKFENVTLGSQFSADIDIAIANTGEVWVRLGNIHYIGNPIGTMILWQGMHQFNTFRSRFALSKTSAVSSYGFGGNANLSILEPTAGREAITTPSLQILQQLVSQVDRFVSEKIAATLLANVNTSFMEWAYRNSRYDLCSNLRIRLEPNSQSMLLGDIRQLSKTIKYNYFEGSDIETIEQLTTNDSPLIVLSMGQPRRRCEQAYLTKYCNVNRITDAPSVISVKDPNYMTIEESAFVLRLTGILQSDYFVQVGIHFGKISHALPVYIDTTLKPINIILDSDSSSISTILKLYDEDPLAFTGIIKDFIRSVIFPRISNFVPSSTKQGAQAFLKAIRQRRDIFEYEKADSGSLSDIWQKYVNGDLTMTDAAERSTIIVQGTIQTFDRSAARRVSSIIPDVLEHEKYLKPIESSDELEITMALPAITRLDVSSTAKLLTIEDEEPALKGYRCFIALTERARSEQGEFFLQPHRTEIIWSGQKVLYVFLHHSGQFGLYYDIQSNEIISTTPGGKAFQTCTILLKDQIYIPIPDEISERFIPTDEKRKRFEIRFDLLYPNSD